jgi:YVTN family beta-propeller protein
VCSSLAITPDGSQVYATRSDINQVSIIDTATNKAVGSPIQLDAPPVRVAAAPDGNHMYFITSLPGSLVARVFVTRAVSRSAVSQRRISFLPTRSTAAEKRLAGPVPRIRAMTRFDPILRSICRCLSDGRGGKPDPGP